MKIQITFKSPGALDCATANLSKDEKDEAAEVIEKFIKYDEYITIEFDTETKTARVLET